MKIVKLDEMLQNGYLNELQSKIGFDNVDDINAKPSAQTEGFTRAKIPDSAKSDNDDVTNNFIIADKPNLYKQNGDSVSNIRFIKFIPSEKSDWLQENHPNAFLLLCLIAKRARRTSGHPDGLEIGMAQIGDYKSAGIETEKKYRTAKNVLLRLGAIEIIETSRKSKKWATQRAINGTLVKILKSDVWDINQEDEGDPKGEPRATRGRPKGDEQECKEDEEEIDLIDHQDRKILSDEKKENPLKEDKKSNNNNLNEKKMKIDEDEIYRFMLKYPNEIVKEAISRARPKVERGEISNVIRYIQTTCDNMIEEKKKNQKYSKKPKPKPIGSEPPEEVKPFVKWPGL